ncbi:MAG: 3-isopropylmalate dehydratase [Candidatus Marinimicrobia bacterium]|jgi:3-isopropylmalate/(R)-2-methylmalate dehydratase small subunit|nr:3-isopropylmalate dehydratase [Candidatus Neomarinimicrobiota bacterium]MBT3496183.1 3-isopropylmalate dehydratase [Candidatus Neomarinimicrobiota bacterium]MBT3691680.1 3-isopropylmalate dehydratase [Candidatus Neomarinimicrobiota bacterium]MBT3732453.1 3-isopropylmalate dehydratase [Candidatus Neomarinimicrobiota bacterium]MBT4143914.1 3-isopropylmalate dehydratase [Candidatus Neomarinimicrobiota bacterium]
MTGRVHLYDIDNIDTDRIIPGKYTKTLNVSTFADHCLEDLDSDFKTKVQQGDILVGGWNFGCGSSREQAPIALKVSGISVVIARSFSRIFYRNAINIGLPILEIPEHDISDGTHLHIEFESGKVVDGDTEYSSTPLPQIMIDILNAGGLVQYLKKNKAYNL